MVEYLTIKNLKNRKKLLKLQIKSQCYSYKVKEQKNQYLIFLEKAINIYLNVKMGVV